MVEDIYLHECMWDQRLEDELYANNVPWDCVQYIRNVIWNWKESGEPDYLDHLIVFCFERNIRMTNEILQHLANSSQNRLNREYSYRTNKGGLQDESQKIQAMFWVMKLVEFCGLTQNDACEKATAMIHREYPSCGLRMASSMDKKYSVWKKQNSNLIDKMKSVRKKRCGYEGWSDDEIVEFLSFFEIELAPRLKGNRRE